MFVNLIIMDVVHDLHQVQSGGLLNAPHPIHACTEAHITSIVHIGETVVRIIGRIDIGFSHGLPQPAPTLTDSSDSSLPLDTYLAVMQTKRTLSNFDAAFTQLLAYLSMIHRARARKLIRDTSETGNSTVYGVLSDGARFVFLCIDNASIVRLSNPFPRPPDH